jgi:hypothetical protein
MDFFQWVDHVGALPWIWEPHKTLQKDKRFALRPYEVARIVAQMRTQWPDNPVPASIASSENRIRGSRQIPHF